MAKYVFHGFVCLFVCLLADRVVYLCVCLLVGLIMCKCACLFPTLQSGVVRICVKSASPSPSPSPHPHPSPPSFLTHVLPRPCQKMSRAIHDCKRQQQNAKWIRQKKMAEEQDRTTWQKTMTEETDKEHGRRTTEEHDWAKIHKQNCKLTNRVPNEDYKSTWEENGTRALNAMTKGL